jgi:hypothetical protein
MYVIHATRRTFHVPIWELAHEPSSVFIGSHTGTAAAVQYPFWGGRVHLSAGPLAPHSTCGQIPQVVPPDPDHMTARLSDQTRWSEQADPIPENCRW